MLIPSITVLEVITVLETQTASPVDVPVVGAEDSRQEVTTVVLVVAGSVVTLEENEVESDSEVTVWNSVCVGTDTQDIRVS